MSVDHEHNANQMQLIELLGPSGVGKTSILKQAILQHTTELILVSEISYEWFFTNKKEFNQAVREYIDDEIDKFIEVAYQIILNSTMRSSQKMKAFKMLETSAEKKVLADLAMKKGYKVICDELFLHRAFSILMYSNNLQNDTYNYFGCVPLPLAAVIVRGKAETILERVKKRTEQVNCYYKKNDNEILELINKALQICEIAKNVLCDRGVMVKDIASDCDIETASSMLNEYICEFFDNRNKFFALKDNILPRLKEISRTFRKKQGVHVMSNPDVMYCSFSTPQFIVHAEESERNSIKRFRKFGINKECFEGKSILDLGCNAGAMLFQASNYNIAHGMGIEYDLEKVLMADKIRKLSNLDHLQFECADIDKLHADDIGEYDIVFCLAVLAHIMDEEHLFKLLGKITKQRLYFEGNSNTDIKMVKNRLLQVGFQKIVELGTCDDDVKPRNNNRPLVIAVKR